MIPLFTLTRQNKLLKEELQDAVRAVIDSGVFILGPKVAEFEKEFAKYIGVKYAVGVASGTDAISLALLAVGVGRGDEVIIPANAYPSVFAVTEIGAIPKLVDIDPATYNIDPSKISQAITDKTKAILPVHIYGQPADMEKILEIGKKYKIAVVEDCAQAVGAEVRMQNSEFRIKNYKEGSDKDTSDGGEATTSTPPRWRNQNQWRKVGSIGDIGCYSFYPTKNLGAFGDGGMVVTDNSEIYKKVKLLRMYGEESRYHSVILGRNSRLDELQAAILLVKMKYLDGWNERRRKIADLYVQPRKGGPCKWPYEVPYVKHVYHLFVIRTKKRNELKKYLEEKGIGTAIHYPVPIHLAPSMKFLGYKKGDFPEAERACEEILSLPIFPELTDEEVGKIAETISQFS